MLIDTHAHLNFNVYKDDLDKVIQRALKNSVYLINIGSQYSSSKRAVEIAKKYKQGVYAAVGLHPIHVQDDFKYEEYKKLAKSKKVVAVGEIGLDYKSEYVNFKKRQKEIFLKQLDLAKELNLPIIFHCRLAHDDLINELRIKNYNLKGVVHCFTGTWKQAEKYLEMGIYLGFNGLIFKMNFDEIIKKTPIDKILLETDCPYLTPPQEGEKRNEPIYIKHIAQKIAQIKDISFNEVVDITTKNAQKLFNLNKF